ncbi:MAG: LTA synthase family protein [Cellvibrio sp.]|uniref:LTA synthase family protein n=1 Tax=Cellvibrio sp. TaxID=1965322 RepID=UPI0031A480F3
MVNRKSNPPPLTKTSANLALNAILILFVLNQILTELTSVDSRIAFIHYSISGFLYPIIFIYFGLFLKNQEKFFSKTHIVSQTVFTYLFFQFFYYSVTLSISTDNDISFLTPIGPMFFVAGFLYCCTLTYLTKIIEDNVIASVARLTILIVSALILPSQLKVISFLYIFFLAGYYKGFLPIKEIDSEIFTNRESLYKSILLFHGFALIALNTQLNSAYNQGLAAGTIFSAFISIIIITTLKLNYFSQLSQWWDSWVSWATSFSVSQPAIRFYHLFIGLKKSPLRTFRWIYISNFFLLKYFLLVLTFTCAIFFLFELPLRDWNFSITIEWAEKYYYFLGIGIIVSLFSYLILRSIFSRIFSISSIFSFLTLFAITNKLKLNFLDSPLLPSDFYIIDQAFESLIFVAGKIIAIAAALTILAVIGGVGYLFWLKSIKVFNHNRLTALRGVVALTFILLLTHQSQKLIDSSHLPEVWQITNASELYKITGFLPGFIYNYTNFKVQKPDGYSTESIAMLSSKLSIQNAAAPLNAKRPHVIVIQSEAYWDPGKLHADLYPDGSPGDLNILCEGRNQNTRACATGYVQVPTFGGATANTEFEILTGASLGLFPDGSIPFIHFMQKPQPSLAWRFRHNGYRTIGMHPYQNWFWNRNKVYPMLGFQTFWDENYFDQEDRNSIYISDRAVNRLIETTLESSSEPTFLFAVTMANHGPFDDDRYQNLEPVTINWDAVPNLSTTEYRALSTYSVGVRESRKALNELIETFEKIDAPPVVVLFYGDHLPILGGDFRIYEETGFKPKAEISTHSREIFSTPYLVWSNTELHTANWPKHLPATLLGQRLANAAGLGESKLEASLDKLQSINFFTRLTLAELTEGAIPTAPSPQERDYLTLYFYNFFDTFFSGQRELDYFGIINPLIEPLLSPEETSTAAR